MRERGKVEGSDGHLAVGMVRNSAGVSNEEPRSRGSLELVLLQPNAEYSDKQILIGVSKKKCNMDFIKRGSGSLLSSLLDRFEEVRQRKETSPH